MAINNSVVREIIVVSIVMVMVGFLVVCGNGLHLFMTIAGLSVILLALVVKMNYRILSLVLIASLYVNLLKPILGIRYVPVMVDLFVALLFLRIFLGKMLSTKRERFFLLPLFEILMILFLTLSIIQIFNPNIPGLKAGLEGFRKTTFQMQGIFLGIYLIKDYRDLIKLLRYVAYASIPIILYGVKQFFSFSGFDQRIIEANQASYWTQHYLGHSRALSIFSGPFHFGMFSCIIALCSLFFYLKERKLFFLGLFILSSSGVILSLTRANVVALVVSVSFLFIFSKPIKSAQLKKVTVVFVIGVCLLLLWLFVPQIFLIFQKLTGSLGGMWQDTRFISRFAGYKGMWGAFLKAPFLGYGMGSAGDTLERAYNWTVHFTSHNLGFKILIETGLIGLILYVLFFLAWFKKAFMLIKADEREIRNLSMLIVSIVTVLLINGLTGSAVEAYPVNLFTWGIMGALVKVWWLKKRYNKEQIKC